jgi:tetratricopeptide (TPR) repeat protein
MDQFWRNVSELSSAAAVNDPDDWKGQSALLDLARFYLSWELAAEAYGPLNIAASGDNLLEQDAQWLTMKGAADVMNGRYTSAIEALDKSSVRTDSAASAWRGLALAEIGDWRKARQAFLQAEAMINAHSPEWAGRFHAAAARAMIRMGDGAEAERHALAAKRSGDDSADGHATLTLGELAVTGGRLDDARSIFTKLLNHPDPNIQVRAELESIKLALATDRMSHLDASDRLDTLRFRWRGDELELEIVSELVDSDFELGRYREALMLSQSFASQFPDLPGARDLRIKLSEHFEQLFLEGRADKLDPIAALALFYEFKDLTPIGPDGDRMIRKLANRLVAFDLLDPATELLAHQVGSRNLIGSSRAKIAADLAAIYLMDRRPEDALMTLNETRQTGLDNDLRLERRLLEAAAHMELQRYGHAIELLEGLNDQSALDLLAEVHWRARTWGAAGRALQRTLPPVGQPLSTAQLQTAIRSAVAYRLDGDMDGLADLRADYRGVVSKTDQADTFELLTGSANVSTMRLSETVRQLADTSSADAFVANLKKRFGEASG